MDLSKDGMARKQGAAKGVAGNVVNRGAIRVGDSAKTVQQTEKCAPMPFVVVGSCTQEKKCAYLHEVEAATKILAVKLGKARRKAQRAASEGRNSQIAHGDLSSGWK